MLVRVPREPALAWPQPGDQTLGQDCVLLCQGGSVPAHSALLAATSPLLSSLLSSPAPCPGCTSPRALLLPEVAVDEARALLQLLYTGASPLPTPPRPLATAPLVRLLGLADMLGVSLPGLTARTAQGRVIRIQEHGQPAPREATPPLPDSAKYRPATATPPPPSPTVEMSPPSTKPSLIASWRNHNQSRPRSPSSPPPGPQARVLVSDTVLMDIMAIKQEVLVDEVVVELEGREEEEGGEEGEEEEEYPDMDNYGRNYVCMKCAKGFTFAKSFNWHSSRCEGGQTPGRNTGNSAGRRQGAGEGGGASREGGASSPAGTVEGGAELAPRVQTSPSKKKIELRKLKTSPVLQERLEIKKCKLEVGGLNTEASRSKLEVNMMTPGVRRTKQEARIGKLDTKNSKPEVRTSRPEIKNSKPEARKSKPEPRNSKPEERIGKPDGRNSSLVVVRVRKPVSVSVRNLSTSTLTSMRTAGRPKTDLKSINRPKTDLKYVNRPKSDLKRKIELAKRVVLHKARTDGQRAGCGRCVKCRLPDCGVCPGCGGASKVTGLRGCVRKVCRNKARRSIVRS